MGCNFPKNSKNTIFYLCGNGNIINRHDAISLKENGIKNDSKITTLTDKKEFVLNIEKFNKERMARYSNYNFSTKISMNDTKNNNSILFKLYDNLNVLIDEIEITENLILSKYKHTNKSYGRNDKISFGKDLKCDYIIDNNSISPIQFYVYYNEIKKKFFIMDNLSGTGTFVKLNKEIMIKQDMIISFCVDYMYFNIKVLKNNSKELNIKFLNNNSENQSEISFDNNEYNKFTIGRSHKCDYQYNDKSVSKVQCTLIYEKNNWYIYDGIYNDHEKKVSTNGLWLLTKNGICLKNNIILKTGDMKIYVSEL